MNELCNHFKHPMKQLLGNKQRDNNIRNIQSSTELMYLLIASK